MKEKRNIITTTYELTNYAGYMVDIVQKAKYAEAWLYHEGIGIKELMFGTEIGTTYTPNYDAFVATVINGIMYDGYIENYENKYNK